MQPQFPPAVGSPGAVLPGPSTVVLSPEGHDPDSTERVPVTGRLRRLLVWFFLLQLAFYLAMGAAGSVFLPLQVQDLDPAEKAGNLALVVVLGSIASALGPPIVGLFSDRTRSRLGRRAPWVLAGSLVAAVALAALGSVGAAGGLWGLALMYLVMVLGVNTVLGPFQAVMPDRIPRGVRGLFSALSGLGLLLGALGGQVLGSVSADAPLIGYSILALLVLAAGIGFVVLNPDHDSYALVREPLRWTEVLRGYWFSPREHPDFAYGFLGRALTFTGYYLISTYSLYLLQDYIGLGDDAVSYLPLFAGVTVLATLVSTVVGGPLSDRIGRRKPLVAVSGSLIGLSVLGPWISPTVAGYAVCCVIGGLGFGAFLAVDQALLSEILPSKEDNGRNLGLLNIGATLPGVVAPAVAGTIVTAFGYGVLFPVAMVITVSGAFAVMRIRSVR